MRFFLRLIGHLLMICLLTVLTQVGGLVWMLSILVRRLVFRKKTSSRKRRLRFAGLFLALYGLTTFIVLPVLVPLLSGRVPLPVMGAEVAPLNFGTVLLNRHYVTPELKETILQLGEDMAAAFPGHRVLYLDANFPLIKGFPLPPHLSHSDGQKLDLAFSYRKKDSHDISHSTPSWIGYGGCEIPRSGEQDMPVECARRGSWQYSLLYEWIGAQDDDLELDETRTVATINWLCARPEIRKIFVEPHLKQRWKLNSDKVRFHGCQAVRHDDHIHLQL